MTPIPFPVSPGAAAASILHAALDGHDQLVHRLVAALPDRHLRNVLMVVTVLVGDHGSTPKLREALQRHLEPTTPGGAA